MSEDRLVGWLVFFRHQNHSGVERTVMPKCVTDGLVARGWLEIADEVDWEGDRGGHIADAGLAITDLNAAEWGIDALPKETEA